MPQVPPTTTAPPRRVAGESPRSLRAVVIGAGMSGILAAIRLRAAGIEDVVVHEKADRLGGTWRENTYPGIACDVPSHLYSYSFAPNPGWSHRFAAGAEIQAYFEDVARRFGVDALIRYGSEIHRLAWEEGRWRITAADGTTDAADLVIAATGVLHHPSVPDLPGRDRFAGALFHSARWDHAVPLAGKRVGVVGTGSSAVQIVGALVGTVAELVLFQRTAQWIAPTQNPAYSDAERAAFQRDPEAIAQLRAEVSHMFTEGFANHISDMDSPQMQMLHAGCVAHLEHSVRDPHLREQLRPTYRAGCKRLVMSENFYAAIQEPNARLVTAAIAGLEPDGVRTGDGRLHALDVLVLATGFRVDRFMRPMQIVGRGGTTLEAAWREGPSAYLAVAMPDFPNLFMLNGPNGPVGNFSLIEVAELQCTYILQLVERLRAGGCREVSPTPAAMQRFDADRREAARTTIWNSGCRSWYLDAGGLPTAWPWTFDRFRDEMRAPRLDHFDLR